MGLFDKLKKATSFITGNSAKIELNVANGYLGAPLTVNVTAKVGENPLEVKNVYLKIRCTETTKEEVETDEGKEIKEDESILFDEKIIIADGGVFEGSKEYSFTKEVTLPADQEASLNETSRVVVWQFLAGLDTKGNDPDSGWKQVIISKQTN